MMYSPQSVRGDALAYQQTISDLTNFAQHIALQDKALTYKQIQANTTTASTNSQAVAADNTLHIQSSVPVRGSESIVSVGRSGADEQQFAREKHIGNQLYAEQRYNESLPHYTKCTILVPTDITGWSNRAQCYLKLHQYRQAASDCTEALHIDSGHIKSLYRRALAYQRLAEYDAALRDVAQVLELDRTNKQAAELAEQIQQTMRNKQHNKTQTSELSRRTRVPIANVESDIASSALSRNTTHSPTNKLSHGTVDASTTDRHTSNVLTSTSSTIQKHAVTQVQPPRSAVECQKTYRSIRKSVSQFADYLQLIDASTYNTMLATIIDAQVITDFIHAWNDLLQRTVPSGEVVVRSMRALSTVSRFSVACRMVDRTTQQVLVHCIHQARQQGVIDETQAGQIANTYHIMYTM